MSLRVVGVINSKRCYYGLYREPEKHPLATAWFTVTAEVIGVIVIMNWILNIDA